MSGVNTVGKYKPYPSYKDSGVEWIGDVPEHWGVTYLGLVSKRISVGLATSVTKYYRDSGIPIIRNLNIKEGYFDDSKMLYLDDEFANKEKSKMVYAGDVIAVHTGSNLGLACTVPDKYNNCHTFTTLIVTTDNNTYNNYLVYCINSNYGKREVERLKQGIGKDNLNVKEFREFKVLKNSLHEQQSIVNFLDQETGKIELLIEKQLKLIELLKEKRHAVISHAVTKGLNPNTPLKDSGIAWLGQIPEHWSTSAIKHIVATPVTDGPHETPPFLDEGVPFISAEAISKGFLNFDKKRAYISEELNKIYSRKYSPKKFDIYMVKSGATTGVTAIVETDDVFNIWSPLAVIRCKQELSNPYFVLNFMRSREFKQAIELGWNFGTQQNIGMGVIENISVTTPPIEEQNQIARYLHDKTQKIDILINKSQQAVVLLKERKTALISAAVTGKIDVRELG